MIRVLTKDVGKSAFSDGHLGGPALFVAKLIESCKKQGIADFTFDPGDRYDAVLDGTINLKRATGVFSLDEIADFRRRGKPFILRLNGVGPKAGQEQYISTTCEVIGQASHIIYQSRYCKEAWLGRCGCSVIDQTPNTIIMNGDAPRRFEVYPMFASLPGITFGAVGSWGPGKKLDFIVDVFKHLIRQGVDVSLLLGGRFKHGVAVPTIEDEFKDRIVFCGYIEPSDVPAFYRSADAFIHARAGDWCPNSVVEALCAGLPGVVHSVGGTSELLGDAGVTFDTHDVAQASRCIVDLIDNYAEYKAKVAGRIDVLNIDFVAQRYIEAIKQHISPQAAEGGAVPGGRQDLRLILSDPPVVLRSKARAAAGDPSLKRARERILERAAAHLETKPLTVTQKKILAPSGNPNDYMSMSPYHWPNPETADGFPYVLRDGEVNPEARQTDLGRFQKLAVVVPDLGWAYFLSDEERFAAKAIEFVRTWFIDPATRMNPHLRYAGHVPGVIEGRRQGLTDTKSIRFILDAIGFLRTSPAWTDADDSGIQAWVSDYLDWILTSEFGHKEFKAKNNHGTWHDVQVLACALFTGREDVIEKIEKSVKRRITHQFTPEGAQPEEMKRTRPLQYCLMNLQGFFENATMLSMAGRDVWQFEALEGQSLRRAAEWLAPYAVGHRSFPAADVVKSTPRSYLSVFRRAAIVWSDWRFEAAVHMIDSPVATENVLQIQYPLDLEFGAKDWSGACRTAGAQQALLTKALNDLADSRADGTG